VTLPSGTRLPGLALAAALLAACSVQPQRPAPPAADIEVPAPSPPEPSPSPPPPVEAPAVPASPWQRIRDRFVMASCDDRPEVLRWARRYTSSPERFAASWDRALPFLSIVIDELERRDLPGEFAMLPYVESGYEPVASRGNRPAGMWQLMPRTARAEGLVVRADYDARLDAVASTGAALDLIQRYGAEFGDWRLADMAFNSGEYRVKKLLRGRDAHALSAQDLARLPFNPITHEHLDRLLALSCVVADPARFGVTLPEPDPGEQLSTVVLQSGMDVRLAARLAGVDPADMKRFNAAYRRHRMVSGMPYVLRMPADSVDRFQAAAQSIPVALWNDWREQRATRTGGLASWAAELGIPVTVLATANAIGESATIEPATPLLVPGREADPPPELPTTYVVKRGDTLSAIARRHHVTVAELKRLNPRLDARRLHPGDRVRLAATD